MGTTPVAAEDQAVAILDAAGDDWAAEARRRRWTIQSEHDEHRRDRITVAGHVLYRHDQSGRWEMVHTPGDLAHLVRAVRLSQVEHHHEETGDENSQNGDR